MGQSCSRSSGAPTQDTDDDKPLKPARPVEHVHQGDTHHGPSSNNGGVIAGAVSHSTIIGTQTHHHHPRRTPRTQPDHADTIPLWKNKNFHGRTAELKAIHAALYGDSANPAAEATEPHQRSCLVHGIGGMGKTQVALEYVHRYREYYHYIFWIRAETQLEMVQDMEKILTSLNLDRPENAPSGVVADTVRTWFASTIERKWLVVFDNVESLESLTPYRPRSNHGSVLLTSQHAEFGSQTSSSIGLEPFGPEEAADLLMKNLKSADIADQRSDAVSLCRELGGLPLAIAHVAGYMTESSQPMSPRETLGLFKELPESNDVFNIKPNTTFGYNKALNFVWDIALDELDPDELKLMRVLSMLNPDGVPVEMLQIVAPEPGLEFLVKPRKTQFRAMIRSLSRRQLITRAKPSGKAVLVTHRSLQRSILHKLDSRRAGESTETGADNLQSIFEAALALLCKVLPDQSPIQFPMNGLWEVMEIYSPHVMSLRKVYHECLHSLSPSVELAVALCGVANYFWERNMFGQAILACDTAEQICDHFPGRSLKFQADVFTLSTAVRHDEGITQRRGSRVRALKALSLRQQYMNLLTPNDATADDVHNYANAWSVVGYSLLEHNLFEQAIDYFDFAMAIRDRVDSDACRMNMMSAALKSMCLAGLGKLDEATALIAPDSEFETWPPDFVQHVMLELLKFKQWWSTIHLRAGRIDKAYAQMRDILDIRCRSIGPFSRAALDACYILAMIERQRPNPSAAEAWLRRGLDRPEEWTDESRIRAKYHLGKLLLARGDGSGAETLLAEARDCKDRLLENHGGYLIGRIDPDDEDAIFDHLVDTGAGRIAAVAMPHALTPKMDGICRAMKQSLIAATTPGRIIDAGEIVQHLRYAGVLPEALEVV